jgi:hypothetical protein
MGHELVAPFHNVASPALSDMIHKVIDQAFRDPIRSFPLI